MAFVFISNSIIIVVKVDISYPNNANSISVRNIYRSPNQRFNLSISNLLGRMYLKLFDSFCRSRYYILRNRVHQEHIA